MSSQLNNNFITVPTSPNPYITRRLNNIDKTKAFKNEWDDWTRTYHKTLKELEAMIDVQKQVQNIMKIAKEANITITEMKKIILKASTNNWMMNVMNILGISEDLWNLIQYDMENRMYQIQWMLADELDVYKGRGNKYVNDNIKEIQDLYRDEEQRKEAKN